MIKFLKEKHSKFFKFIPLKLPLIIIIIIALSSTLYFLLGSADGFFINLITELIGILVTIYIVTYLLLNEKRAQWNSVKNILQNKLKIFITSFYLTLSELFHTDINSKFISLSYLTKGPDRDKLKKLVYDRVEPSLNKFAGKDLDKLITELDKEKRRLTEIIGYMEKRPSFLHNIKLYEIEDKLDSIVSGYWFNKLIHQIKDDKLIVETNSNFVKGLVKDLKEIINNVDYIDNQIKIN